MPLSNSNDVPPSTSLVFPSSKIVKLPKVLDGESFIVDFFNFEFVSISLKKSIPLLYIL